MIGVHTDNNPNQWVGFFDALESLKHLPRLFSIDFLGFEVGRNDKIVLVCEYKRSVVVKIQILSVLFHQVGFDPAELLFEVNHHRVMIFMLHITRNKLLLPINVTCFLEKENINVLMKQVQHHLVLLCLQLTGGSIKLLGKELIEKVCLESLQFFLEFLDRLHIINIHNYGKIKRIVHIDTDRNLLLSGFKLFFVFPVVQFAPPEISKLFFGQKLIVDGIDLAVKGH